jgi:hypothetical protein
MVKSNAAKWARMATAPRDGTLVLARIRASEQGPAEVDAVRWARSARSGEEGWVANDSDPFARVVYADSELSGWMPLPTQVPEGRSSQVTGAAPQTSVDETDGSSI